MSGGREMLMNCACGFYHYADEPHPEPESSVVSGRDANQLAADVREGIFTAVRPKHWLEAQHDELDFIQDKAASALDELVRLVGTLQQERSALAATRQALADGARIAAQYLDTERGDLDGWVDRARALADTGGDTKEPAPKHPFISDEPLNDAQMSRAVDRSEREGWKDIEP